MPLDQLIKDEPGDCPASERLAVLAAQAGRAQQAGELRQRKRAMGLARQRYIDLYNQNQFVRICRSSPGWPRPSGVGLKRSAS